MTKYHDLVFGNKLYSGRRRYFSQYVQNYPLPKVDNPHSKKIISLSKQLCEDINKQKEKELVDLLEQNVLLAFGIS